MDKIIDIYKQNEQHSSFQRRQLMYKFSIFTEMAFFIACVTYSLAGLFYFINPIYTFFWHDKFIPLLSVYIPFIDENTTSGFILLFLIHVVYIALSVIGSVSTDFLFFMMILNVPLLSIIFGDQVREFNDILRGKQVNEQMIKEKLKGILLMHRYIWE